MRQVFLNKHKFELYDSIENLPISQFHRYSKYLLVEGGVGDSYSDIDAHIGKILEYMKSDVRKASAELLNMRQNIYMVLNEQDLRNKAVLCLVKSVDGKKWEDFSDSGIQELYDMVKDATIGEMDKATKDIVERLDEELEAYFPSLFSSAKERGFVELLRRRALLQLETITKGKDNSEAIEEITKQIYAKQGVKSFEGKESAEIEFDKQFEEMCLALAKEFGGKVKDYSVMEFYSAYERMEKQAQEIKKLHKK